MELLNIVFCIGAPWTVKFKNLWSRSYSTPFNNKFIELSVYKYSSILLFNFIWSVQTDHAGVECVFGLFGYNLECKFYDSRHWPHM